ncbi:hypothetical protein M413DRAFT_439186 [Hebeloma cylindrosporum]|uniref:Uncharacterized protein n=1 Tax=Hebeloma cylindrosporum TaxID=76867 RepID=A0A0C3CTT3_HEBCY|nr:hypothetical protein M413DRAFT_439186 [Hebeloma cylindrosporum h7]
MTTFLIWDRYGFKRTRPTAPLRIVSFNPEPLFTGLPRCHKSQKRTLHHVLLNHGIHSTRSPGSVQAWL